VEKARILGLQPEVQVNPTPRRSAAPVPSQGRARSARRPGHARDHLDRQIDDALGALRDGLDVTPVISHRFPLDQAAQALAVAADPTSTNSKVMLRLADGPPGT
jgi:hypothetical protein